MKQIFVSSLQFCGSARLNMYRHESGDTEVKTMQPILISAECSGAGRTVDWYWNEVLCDETCHARTWLTGCCSSVSKDNFDVSQQKNKLIRKEKKRWLVKKKKLIMQFQFPFQEKINSLHIPHYDLYVLCYCETFSGWVVGKI